MMFSDSVSSHAHSLTILQSLYEYDDFMESIGTMCDMGCGSGLDIEWWATRTTRDEDQRPLDIQCLGVDQHQSWSNAGSYKNVRFYQTDFENFAVQPKKKFDVIWCHDSFQYAVNPMATLRAWRDMMNVDGMLILILPQTTNVYGNELAFDQPSGVFFNWTMVSLIHVLSMCGFDCSGGYFLKDPTSPWLHAVVYKTSNPCFDAKNTTWYHLSEAGVLPQSAVEGIKRHGYLRQRDLVLPWLDRQHRWLGES